MIRVSSNNRDAAKAAGSGGGAEPSTPPATHSGSRQGPSSQFLKMGGR